MRRTDTALASFDFAAFGAAVSAAYRRDGAPMKRCAAEAGVTFTDFSRAAGGGIVSVAKVIALCDWLGRDPHDFYRPPERRQGISTGCTGPNVKHERVSHGAEGGGR